MLGLIWAWGESLRNSMPVSNVAVAPRAKKFERSVNRNIGSILECMGISSAHFVRCALLIVAFAGLAVSQNKPLPKPQVADAEGKAAPDFTLKDQDGKDFRLSEHRGER